MSRSDTEISTKSAEQLRFGHLWFDPVSLELRGDDGTSVDLRRQSLRVLAYLAERQGQVVGKDDLVSAIWSDVAVTDDSLIQCIGDIRRALGPDGRRVVQTVRRRGYRLVPSETSPTPGNGAASLSSWTKAKLLKSLGIGVLGVGAVALLLVFGEQDAEESFAPPNQPVIAVLPFTNSSDNSEQQYFVDGLSEDIATDLSRVSGLRMISSASSFAAHDADASPLEIARGLGAGYVVSGSARRDKRRVRVTATLTDVASGETLWADRYDRDIGAIFDLQDDVSRSVVSSLAIQLTNDEQALFRRQQAINSDAYDLLLRGLAPLRTFTENGIEEARSYFRRAIEADQDYARAHAALALTYGTSILFRLGDKSLSESFAMEEAQLAVSLDPKLPQAQFAMAVVLLSEEKHDDAIGAAREAVRLDPSYADGYAVLAQTLAYGGDKDEALSAITTAKTLSPRYTFAYLWVEGHILFQLRRYEEARAVLEDVVQRNPEMLLGILMLAATYGQLGLAEEADWLATELATISPDLSAFNEGRSLPYRSGEDRAHYVEGLLLAGVPE
jgi:TolB-like protein/DNA-binding winged helix-turn-helix (wHTH) protein